MRRHRARAAGQPVVRIEIEDPYDLGAEFFRWEFATAVAGSVLGSTGSTSRTCAASKTHGASWTTEYEKTGTLPPETRLRVDDRNVAAQLERPPGHDQSRRLRRAAAYLEMTDAHEAELQKMRTRSVTDTKVARCVGFGPRFLHSTGQGTRTVRTPGSSLRSPATTPRICRTGTEYTFGVVKAAQARGDLESSRRGAVARCGCTGNGRGGRAEAAARGHRSDDSRSAWNMTEPVSEERQKAFFEKAARACWRGSRSGKAARHARRDARHSERGPDRHQASRR